MGAPAAALPLTVCGACSPLCRLDRDHPERVQFAAFIGDRDIFAGCKLMGAEAIARLVVIIALGIVVEHPPGMLGTTRLMDQASGLVLLTLPKSANATLVAMGLPSLGIDMSLGVQRSNELIAVILRSSRMLLRARKLEADRFQRALIIHGQLLVLKH